MRKLAYLFSLAASAVSGWLGAAEPRQWPVEFKSGRYQIHADFPLVQHADLLQDFSSLSTDIDCVLGIATGQQPVHVVLFQSGMEYQRYMQTYFPDLPVRRAMYLQDRGPGMLFTYWHPDVETDLRHEITHALLNDAAAPLPLWLDEGLAEYFEVIDSKRFVGNSHLADVQLRSRQGLVPSLRQLESIQEFASFREQHYRDSWSWVHFLIHRNAGTRRLLADFLRAHRSGAPQLDLSRQLMQICPDPSQEYSLHFRALDTAPASN